MVIFGLYATNSGRASKGYHVDGRLMVRISIWRLTQQLIFPLRETDVKLKTYTGEVLRTCGQMLCKVVYSGQEHILPMIVAENEGKPTLLGWNWLEKLKIDWNEVFSWNETSRSE